jgi:hypothetical protein
MPYGTKSVLGGGALAMTGLATGAWIVAAVTLLLLGVAIVQLVRPAPAHRP